MTTHDEENIQLWATPEMPEDPELENDSDLETTAESEDVPTDPEDPATVTVNGTEYTVDQLEELVAASSPEAIQKITLYDRLEEAMARDPEATIKLLASQYNVSLGDESFMTTADWEEEPTANELALKRQLDSVGGMLSEIRNHLAGQGKEAQAIEDAKESIAEQYGQNVSAKDLRVAVQKTGIKDPEAAWLKLNAQKVISSKAQQAAQSAGGPKPVMPKDGAKEFDNFSVSPTEFVNRLKRGEVPKHPLGRK